MPATLELLQEGRYRITQESSQDGPFLVYEAHDTIRVADVVIKEIAAPMKKVMTHSQLEILKLAFISQAKNLTEITHDSLIKVYDYFTEIGRNYLVMESVEGDDLSVLLERNNSAFPLSDAVEWADQTLDAMHYLHSHQPPIFHQSIKPANIKLTSTGKIKLLGFGSVDSSGPAVNTSLHESDANELCYAPLEQIWAGLDAASQKVITNSYDEKAERLLKEPPDARSDIYSLGATLYHLITAKKPVDALERSIDILDGKADPLRAPVDVDPNIAPEISDFLMKAMEIKRENRFDSAVIMRQVLKTAQVRAKERAEEELREQEEAAKDLLLAHKTRQEQVNDLVEQKRREMEAEQQRQTELIKEQLRKAEEQRLLAEQRAAEAERLLQEKEAALLAKQAAEKEENLLELMPDQDEPVEALAEDEPSSELAEAEELPEARMTEETAEVPDEQTVDDKKEYEREIEISVQTEAAADSAHFAAADVEAEESGPTPEKVEAAKPSSPVKEREYSFAPPLPPSRLPMIGIGAAVIVVAAVALWFFLSGSQRTPSQSAPIQAAETRTAQPAPQIQQQVAPIMDSNNPSVQTDAPAQPVSAFTETSQPDTDATPKSVAQQPAGKAKKPAAAKGPASQKKTVTVDDLINDN